MPLHVTVADNSSVSTSVDLHSPDEAAELTVLGALYDQRTIVFTHRNAFARHVLEVLAERGVHAAVATTDHHERDTARAAFVAGVLDVLVCTDDATRTWDPTPADQVLHVELPPYKNDVQFAERISRRTTFAARATAAVVA